MTRELGPDRPGHDGPGSPTAARTGMNCVPEPAAKSTALRGVQRVPPLYDVVTVMRGTPVSVDAPDASGKPRSDVIV